MQQQCLEMLEDKGMSVIQSREPWPMRAYWYFGRTYFKSTDSLARTVRPSFGSTFGSSVQVASMALSLLLVAWFFLSKS